MKRPTLRGSSKSSQTDTDEEFDDTTFDDATIIVVKDADKRTIEIGSTTGSKGRGRGLSRLLVLLGAAIGVAYWMQKSQKPTEVIQDATGETADRTRQVTEQATKWIQESTGMLADRVEEETETASEQIQQAGEEVADRTEEAGEEAAETAEEAGEEAADKMEESGPSSSID